MMVPELESLFRDALPGDPDGPPRTPRQVYGAHWSHATPTPVSAPKLAVWAPEVASLLGWPETPDPMMAEALSGNRLLPGSKPYAMAYGGHQFGHWAGQLGDGRAIVLGEAVHGPQRFEIQLKGAGRTPYSRQGDGRAVLRSSIREFLCSESMHHLGVPTTRALALVTTGDEVVRDMFYDGRPKAEPGAIVTRVAPTFVRLGNFELFADRADISNIERLLDWVIQVHHPELTAEVPARVASDVASATRPTTLEQRIAFFVGLCERTARTVAHWMALGFVHGVMNTDNLSVLGLTIDYGPYGWLDHYDPGFTPNTTDAGTRRYAFGRQASVALWNLARLGDALAAVIPVPELERGLGVYRDEVQAVWTQHMARKLGLQVPDEALVGDLLALMGQVETDWTLFFRRLSDVSPAAPRVAELGDVFYLAPGQTGQTLGDGMAAAWQSWLERHAKKVRDQDRSPELRRRAMLAENPWFIPRNHLVFQEIARAASGDFTGVNKLLEAARHPYDQAHVDPELAGRRPEWARQQAGVSALSCSS